MGGLVGYLDAAGTEFGASLRGRGAAIELYLAR